MKLLDEIILNAKTNKILVLFDMDGTLVEYGTNEKPNILSNKPNFFLEKEPILAMLNVAESLSQINNIKVGILSNCYYNEQKQDKLSWIEKNAPFFDLNNRHIIVYNNIKFKKEEKRYLKVNKIKTIEGFDQIYLIEDNHENISATNTIIPNSAHHLSRLLI